MIKINGKEYGFEENDYLINDLVKRRDLQIINGKYFWTEFHLRKLRKNLIRLNRSINNPLWNFYYRFFDW